MIDFPLGCEKSYRYDACTDLCNRDGKPDPVYSDKQRKQQHRQSLEYQSAEEGDAGGDSSVVQGREKSGCKQVKARKQEGKCKQVEGVCGKLIQVCIISHKYLRQRCGQADGKAGQQDAGAQHQYGTLAEHIFKFSMVSCTVVVADDGGAADGIANGYGNKNKLHIHQDSVCRDPVFSDQTEKLEVIEHTNGGGRNAGHDLGGAVGTGFQDRFWLQSGTSQPKQAGIRP